MVHFNVTSVDRYLVLCLGVVCGLDIRGTRTEGSKVLPLLKITNIRSVNYRKIISSNLSCSVVGSCFQKSYDDFVLNTFKSRDLRI